jgi:hypothetical protein
MDTLEQLFHSMPEEVREKIIRFTYKPQAEELLTEIRDFYQAKEYLQELTIIIDRCNHIDGFIETSHNIHESLCCGLNIIRNSFFRKLLLQNWKYNTCFNCAIITHEYGKKVHNNLTWEQSFALYFWMCIYH